MTTIDMPIDAPPVKGWRIRVKDLKGEMFDRLIVTQGSNEEAKIFNWEWTNQTADATLFDDLNEAEIWLGIVKEKFRSFTNPYACLIEEVLV